MCSAIKKVVRRLIFKEKADSDTYIKYLLKKGCTIGKGTYFYSPKDTFVDPTRPFLITIGENVKITKGVTLLTHGFDWCVLKQVYGDVLGSSGKVNIGNNVFIGMNTTVLKGVNIGDNVIIGANSLVNKDIPNNCVAAGNPIKVICSLEDYYKKRKSMQLAEAEELVKAYREKWGGGILQKKNCMNFSGSFLMLMINCAISIKT